MHPIPAGRPRPADRRSASGRRRHLLLRAVPSGAVALLFSGSVLAVPGPAPAGFFHAIARDDEYDVRVYLLRGATSSMRDAAGVPALVHAASERAFRVLRSFLAIPGVDVDVTNAADETALMFAALHGHIEIATLLIEKGAQVNRPRWTPLHYAATGGHRALARLLLEEHAYIDAESPNRTTPLMMSVRHGHQALTRELLEAGADPTVRNDAGLSAADYAAKLGDRPLADWLRLKSAEFSARYPASVTVRR